MINIMFTEKDKKNLIRINKAELARRIGRSRTWVTLVMNGKTGNKRYGRPTRKLIAEALGVPYEELWGEEKKK
ncbi:hypothetical protein [Thermodesulfovibrio sp.]|uniref:hypothetical protein n=1 Tax=Thermodesulfovibrio sp. TaxID=2067987 RepID=UPI0030A4F095